MSKPPRIVIPGLNRGAGIPPGYTLGRRRGTGKGPAELLDLAQMRGAGLATSAQVAQQVDALSTALSATTMGASPAVAFVTDDCDHDDGMPNPEMGLNQKADIKNVVAVVDDTANWGSPRFKRMLGTSPSGGFSIGDNAVQDTITIGRFDGDDIGFMSLDAQGFTGGTFFGGTRNAITNRMVWSVYGIIAGIEFDHDIYVNSDKIYHEGNLSFGSGLTYSGGVLTASGGAGTAGPQGPIGFGMDGMDGEEGMPIPGAPGATGGTGPQGPMGFALDGQDGEEGMPIPGPAGAAGAAGAAGPTTTAPSGGIVTPTTASFSLVSGAGSPSMANVSRGVQLSVPGAGAVDRNALLEVTPGAATWTLTALLVPSAWWRNFLTFGLYAKESATGKIHAFCQSYNTGIFFRQIRWTNITTFSTSTDLSTLLVQGPMWVRLQLDATNFTASITQDGENWLQVYQVAKGSFLSGTIDRAGIFFGVNQQVAGNYPQNITEYLTVMSYTLV